MIIADVFLRSSRSVERIDCISIALMNNWKRELIDIHIESWINDKTAVTFSYFH